MPFVRIVTVNIGMYTNHSANIYKQMCYDFYEIGCIVPQEILGKHSDDLQISSVLLSVYTKAFKS